MRKKEKGSRTVLMAAAVLAVCGAFANEDSAESILIAP